MNKDDICILLTGTIAPANVPDLMRVDPLERENDYYETIRRWMKLEYPLVFVENSGFESKKIDSLFGEKKNCEYLKFDTQVSFLGKSHGEAEIIKYALTNSIIIRRKKIIAKVSGRQFIRNIITILNYFLKEHLYVIGWFKYGLSFADSRFFVASKEFYSVYFVEESKYIDESKGTFFEHVLAGALLRSIADGKKWSLPNVAPICEGISGTGNIVYKNGLFKIIKGNIIIKVTHWLLNLEY